MKNYNLIGLIILSFSLFIFFNSCEKEPVNMKPVVTEGSVLGAVKLTTDNIPALKGCIRTDCDCKPSIWYEKNGDTISYTVDFRYSWRLSDSSGAEVRLMVANSNELAYGNYLGSKYSISIVRDITDDEPTVAGDYSYNKGSDFVRNNIYVHIAVYGKLSEKLEIIAQQIDELIIKETNFLSLSEVQPVIKVFNLDDNPVLENTETPINLEVEDPNNVKIYYSWKINMICGNKGIVNREFQSFSFFAAYIPDSVLTNQEELTILAINEYGHICDSTILVTTYKN